MPDLIPGSGFDQLLDQVAVPNSNLISSAGFASTPNPQAIFENEFRKTMQIGQSPLTPEFLSPFSIDPTSRYPLQVTDMDNEDIYAQGQSGWNKAWNAVLKGGSLAATTFVQSTLGLVNGVFQAASDGQFSSFYDNEFNRQLDQINKDLENQLPNYYSAAERNNPWYSNIFTTNFIFDKIVKNLGFMAGAAASGNVFARLLQVAKMGATGNLLKGLQATEKAILEGKTLDTVGDAASGFNSFLKGYNALNTGQKVLVSGLATMGEAGIEALQASTESRNRLLEEFRIENGRDATGEDLERINNTASNIGNTTFAFNTALLTASNYIQFPKLLGSSHRAERGMYSELIQKADDVTFDAKKLAYIERVPSTKFGKLFKRVQPFGPSITEGLEEASQYAAQTGSENFWYKKYQNGNEMNLGFIEGISAINSPEAIDDLFGYGAHEAFLTNEGQEQFFIGAVSGAIGKARGTAREQRAKRASTQSFIDLSNRRNLSSYTKDTLDSLNRGSVISTTMEDAVRQGDVLEYKDAERDFIINYLYPKIKHGRTDLLYDEISAYKQQAATVEGFKQLQDQGKALPTDTREAYLGRLDNLERVARSTDLAYKSINTRNAFYTKKDENGKTVPVYSSTVTNKMVYANSKIMDYDERIPLLATNLLAAGVDVESLTEDTSKFDEYSKVVEDLVSINGQSITEDKRTELRTDLKDIVELTMRRKQFIEEYNDMLANPSKYEDVPLTTSPTKPNLIKLTTKDGEEEIEIGTEYYLGKITSDTEEGFLHEKYPILTVLAVNEDGSLRIRDANGTISTIPADSLKGYKLGKVSDVRNNPKANFYMKHRNRIFQYKFKDGKRDGVLRWSPKGDELFFEYKKGNKTYRIPVRNEDFSYKIAQKKGFKEPKLTVTNRTLTDIQEADELGDKEDKLNNKLARRMALITSFVTNSRNRLNSIDKFISDKKTELKKTEDALEAISKTKTGVPRKRYTRALTKTLQELGETKGRLLIEINLLTDEKEELETTLPYFEDLLQNAQELPQDTLELVRELKNEVNALEEIIDNTSQAIDQGNDLIQRIDSALQTAYSLLNDFIRRLKEENPNIPLSVDEYQAKIEKYLGEVGAQEFIINGEGFTPLVKSLQTDIQDFIEELEITPNESKIQKLQDQIADLRKGLDDTIKEQIAKAKILEFFEEKIQEERKKKAEEEAFAKNKALQAQIFSSQKDLHSGDRNGPSSEEQNKKELKQQKEADTSKKKSAITLFSSTSAPSETNVPDADASPSTLRERNFLFNQSHFPRHIRENLKGLSVTINNEDSLGLSGLVFSIARQNTSEGWASLSDEDLRKVVSDPDNGVVLLVYAVEKDGEYIFLNEKGEETSKIDEIVASTLTSTSPTWRDGTSRVRKGEEELAKDLASQWRARREKFLSSPPEIFDLSFSRGLPIYNEDANSNITLSPISGTLFPTSEIDIIKNYQGAIKVITTDNYTHQDISYTTIPGRVYFEYKEIFAPLSNRQFNINEQETIYEVLQRLADQAVTKGTIKGDYLNFLSNVLFWGTPSIKKDTGRNQIWIDEEGLNFGDLGFSVPFTPTSIQQNKANIMAYLSGTYNNINNFTLNNNFHDTFIEYYMDKGILSTREHPNYQSFLIDRQFVETPITPIGTPRENGGRNFMQKYAILQGVEYTLTKKEESKLVIPSQPKQEAKKTEPTAGEWVGKTKAGESIYFTAIQLEGGEIEITVNEAKGDIEAIFTRLRASGLTDDQIAGGIRKVAFQEAEKRFAAMEQEPTETIITVSATQPAIIKAPKDSNTEYRAVEEFSIERMSEEEKTDFNKFLRTNLPQFSLREVEHLIEMAPDRKAWGSLQDKTITLFKQAEKGTGYHEAFEGVWKYFVLPEEQTQILNEFKNREGFFNDRVTNSTISYNEATDQQAKEELADEFAAYKIGKKTSFSQAIKRFFKRIVDFFRSFCVGYKPNTTLRDKLFDKIETGGFKKSPLPTVLSSTPEFSAVRGLSEAQSHGFVQDIVKRVFIKLIERKVDLFEPTNYENIDIRNAIHDDYEATIAQLPNTEETFNTLWQRSKDFLRQFNIEFDENNYVTINDENHTRNEYVNDKMTLDVKKSSPFAIKYLLASLAKTSAENGTGVIYDKTNVVEGYQLLPFAKTFITLLESLSGSTSIENMISKLKSLSKSNSDFIPLFNMLGKKGETMDWDNLTKTQWRTLSGFYNTFNKQKPDAEFLTYNTGTGEVYFSSADVGRASESTRRSWESSIRYTAKKGKNLFVGYNNKQKNFSVNEAELKKLKKNIGNPDTKLAFLERLGVDFTKEDYKKLSKEQRESFANSVETIVQYISTNKGLKIISGKSLGISGPLTQLAELHARVNHSQSESTFINGEGEQQQTYVQPNYFSTLVNIFNQAYSLPDLYKRLPYLEKDPYAHNSELLKIGGKFFDSKGNRTDVQLVLGYPDSIKEDQRGRKIADLDYPQRLTTQINNTLNGKYYLGVPADSSTEWALKLGEFIDFTTATTDSRFQTSMEGILFKYLESEINLAKEYATRSTLSNIGEKARDLRFFKDILSPDNLRKMDKAIANNQPIQLTEAIKADFAKYLKEEISTLRDDLLYNQEIVENKEGNFSYSGLLDAFAERKKLSKHNLTEEELSSLLRYTIGNNIVANTEMHKVFFGDPYNFTLKIKSGKVILDETKRIKSFLSPAIPSLVSPYYNNLFNREFNTIGNTTLKKGIPGYYIVRDTINSTTFSDIVTQSQYVEDFNKNNEADAQALHTLQMHRDLLNRHGQWSQKAEDWYKWEMAYTRQKMYEKGLFSNYPEALQVNDKGRLKNPKPEYILHIIKPIVRGVKNGSAFLNPVLDKFSSAPLVYSAVEGTNLENLFTKMFKENIDYVIFESGRKVGAEGKNNFYNPDGSFNNLPYKGTISIKWSDYSVQVENSYDKGKSQTRGSQITKLFSLDFFQGGTPIDFQGTNWNSLTEDQKQAQSPLYKEVQWNNKLLGEMTKHGYETLIHKLGMVDTGSNFVVTDYSKLYSTLEYEATKRDIPENIKKVFKINPETKLPYVPLESTSEYTRVQKMLYSMVDRSILSPKVNGGPKTQLSVFGWENASKGRSLILKSDRSKELEVGIEILKKAKLNPTITKQIEINPIEALKFIAKQAQNLGEDMLPLNDGREELVNQAAEEQYGFKLVSAAVAAFPAGQTGLFRKISKEEYTKMSADTKKKVALTSDTLKFYTSEDPYIEILVPHWFKDKFKKAGFQTDEELLSYLNATEEGKDILRGIGFRIPTSNMTAIETFRIKGFLPQEYGDTIVLPTEITTKAGSDFDIDKLNTYLKNVYLDEKNKIKLVPFFGFGEEAKKEFNKIATKIAVTREQKVEDALEEFEFTDGNEYLDDVELLYKQSLENEYYRSLERAITNPNNYSRLTEATDNETLAALAGSIAELTGTTESNKLTRLLSMSYLSKLRHAFLAGKKWVGIGAVNNTGHSQAQRSNQYIDVENTELSQRDREAMGDGQILLPHNKDSQGRPTLSGLKDQLGNFISSKLGWYLTSFVDIAKDPYILNIIHSRKLVGTALFLERLGINTNTIGYFLNQPVVREYIHFTDIQRVNRVASIYWRDNFIAQADDFSTDKPAEKLNLSVEKLKKNISDYYINKKTSSDWKSQQLGILNEFIKYTKMAEHVFMSTQATNWDTARFATGASVRKKQVLLQKQISQNIIKSPETILNISNNGKIMDAVVLSKEAIDSLSTLTSADIREELNTVLDRYINLSYLPEQTLEKIDSQILNTFIDYLVQTKLKLNGASIKRLVVDTQTSITTRIQQQRAKVGNNPLYQLLKDAISNREEDADNIKIAPFPKEVYEKNLISGYLSEIKELDSNSDGNIKPNSIYGDLIKLALLQGTGNIYTLLPYIPLEDISPILQQVIGPVTKEDATTFAKNFNFERSQWKNTDIVLPLQPIRAKYKFPLAKFKTRVLVLSDIFDNKMGITERPVITLERYHKIPKTPNRIDVISGTTKILKDDIKPMIANFDFSFMDKVGYQKVFIPGTSIPLTTSAQTKEGQTYLNYYYKQVNLLGSNGIQEHYTDQQASILDNGTVKVTSLTDLEIYNEVMKVGQPKAPQRGFTGVTKVISGGQTGGDLGGLEGARAAGIQTGGTAPPGWISGNKSEQILLESYGLVEGEKDPATYPKRTMKNVDDSNGTIAILWGSSVGTTKTIGYASTGRWSPATESKDSGYRPVLVIKTKNIEEGVKQLKEFIKRNGVTILNVAGHRENSQPGIQAFTRELIKRALTFTPTPKNSALSDEEIQNKLDNCNPF